MSDIIFADGLFYKKPHANAPDFVKGSISVKVDEFVPWLEKHVNETGWVNIDMKVSKGGKLYMALNDYKPQQQAAQQAPQPAGGPPDDDIPFAPVDGRYV